MTAPSMSDRVSLAFTTDELLEIDYALRDRRDELNYRVKGADAGTVDYEVECLKHIQRALEEIGRHI